MVLRCRFLSHGEKQNVVPMSLKLKYPLMGGEGTFLVGALRNTKEEQSEEGVELVCKSCTDLAQSHCNLLVCLCLANLLAVPSLRLCCPPAPWVTSLPAGLGFHACLRQVNHIVVLRGCKEHEKVEQHVVLGCWRSEPVSPNEHLPNS